MPEGKARGPLAQCVVDQDEASHGFHQGHRARQHTWIMSSSSFQFHWIALSVHGRSRLKDRGHRFETHPQHNVLAVADAALNSATAVGGRPNAVATVDERVVVLGAAQQRSTEASTQLKGLGGGQGPHGFGEVGVQAVEHRFAPACRHAAGHKDDGASDRVARLFHVLDPVRHAGGRLRMRASHRMGVDLIAAVEGRRQGHADVLDTLYVGADLDAEGGEDLAGDCAGHHARDRFPSRGPPTAADVAEPVFGLVREIRVGGAEGVLQVVVVGRTGCRVGDGEPERCARCQQGVVFLHHA